MKYLPAFFLLFSISSLARAEDYPQNAHCQKMYTSFEMQEQIIASISQAPPRIALKQLVSIAQSPSTDCKPKMRAAAIKAMLLINRAKTEQLLREIISAPLSSKTYVTTCKMLNGIQYIEAPSLFDLISETLHVHLRRPPPPPSLQPRLCCIARESAIALAKWNWTRAQPIVETIPQYQPMCNESILYNVLAPKVGNRDAAYFLLKLARQNHYSKDEIYGSIIKVNVPLDEFAPFLITKIEYHRTTGYHLNTLESALSLLKRIHTPEAQQYVAQYEENKKNEKTRKKLLSKLGASVQWLLLMGLGLAQALAFKSSKEWFPKTLMTINGALIGAALGAAVGLGLALLAVAPAGRGSGIGGALGGAAYAVTLAGIAIGVAIAGSVFGGILGYRSRHKKYIYYTIALIELIIPTFVLFMIWAVF